MPRVTDVLVIADDLSGAADSGVPFALRGMRTVVTLGEDLGTPVVVVDTDSRHLDADAAGATVREAVRAHGAGRLVYKKIDSTLRGNLAAELAALPGPVVVCPASPATGRTVLNGVVHIDGVPLADTSAWALEPGPVPATVAAALAPLPVRTVTLADVRGPRERLRTAITGAARTVVCDAVTDADLRTIAEVCRDLRAALAGAAGLARALAACLPPGEDARPPKGATPDGPALVVVGSAHPASHAQAEHLAGTFPNVLRVPAAELLDPGTRTALSARLAGLVNDGDTVVSVAGPVATASRDLGAALGEAVAPAARNAGLLVLTGGETARSVLTRLGTGGLELLAEPEPGVVLAAARDTTARDPAGRDPAGRDPAGRGTAGRTRHVLTKAGGFGRPATLDLAIQAVRKAARKGHP